ncbi:endolysin [Streptomyces phage RosePharie]|nr:endolysin [Streptomyces phage RosePharie]
MAAPLSASKLVEILKAEGLKVVEVGDWRNHNRNHKGPFGPINGVMIHHTVTKGSKNTVDICYKGHAALPGPLCHGVITKDGVVHLVSSGRANHAGLGDDDVLDAVIAEREAPADNEANTDGNRHFYGFECENLGDGKDPWPAVQVEAMVKASAAICRHYGWNANSVIGHKEWQPGKIDPRGKDFDDMDKFRDRIDARLGVKPSEPKPPAKPKPVYAPFPGKGFFRLGQKHDLITELGKALVRAGWKGYKVGPGREFTRTDIKAVAWFQRKQGWTGSDADGYPGPETWKRLKVAQPKK